MEVSKLPPKVEAIYQAVNTLFAQGADLNNLTVSRITTKAGIGKGTAYEYFPNKEDMIAGALYYATQEICVQLYRKMKQAGNFYEKMQLLFDCMDEQLTETNCLCRVLHTTLDNSAVSKKLRELAESHTEGKFGVAELIRQVISDESKDGHKLDAEKAAFLAFEICSKVICYAMFLGDGHKDLSLSKDKMKQMICEDICRQAAYLKAG